MRITFDSPNWPKTQPRTKFRQQARFSAKSNYGGFREITLSEAVERLDAELGSAYWQQHIQEATLCGEFQFGSRGTTLSTKKEPEDPAVVLEVVLDGKNVAFACDTWTRQADNIAAIAAHLNALRAIVRWGVGSLDQLVAGYAALPGKSSWWQTLGVPPEATKEEVRAAKVVADRLKFLVFLEAILFDKEMKKHLKERSQLHQIVKQNCWLFGEEYNLSVDDQSLTEVLRKHRKLLGDGTVVDEAVKHVSKERGIVDLVLSRSIRQHKASSLTHLVVELKAPKVKVGSSEILQIEEYAMSIKGDERFKAGTPQWFFWVISDDYDDYAKHRMTKVNGRVTGIVHQDDCSTTWVKTWGEIIDENRARLQFFQERLEYEADRGTSLEQLQARYADFLKGVIVEAAEEEAQPEEEDANEKNEA